MNTRAEMETELQERLLVAANSNLFDSSRLTTLIQNSYMWATQMYIWLDLVQAKYTGTKLSEYYDYPDNFRSGTVIRVTVDDVEYDRKDFEDYLDFKEENTNSTAKIFASYGRFYFIHPTPTSVGSNNITVWGAEQADSLASSGDKTIFSDNKVEGNEAVIKKALSVGLARVDKSLAKAEEEEAIAILARLNKYEWAQVQRDQRIQHPKFNVPDYFGGKSGSPIGSFNYKPEGW